MYNKEIEQAKMTLGLDRSDPFYFDEGCKTATIYLVYSTKDKHQQSKCQHCPFPQCIYCLSKFQIRYINASVTLHSLYMLYDSGVNLTTVCYRLNIDYRFGRKCVEERRDIESMLAEWEQITRNKKHPVRKDIPAGRQEYVLQIL